MRSWAKRNRAPDYESAYQANCNRMNLKNFNPAQHQGPLPSPCINVCTMSRTTGLCDGCTRTMDEIIDWGVASEAEKLQIWMAIIKRRSAQ